jgi:hypothetical protein
MDWFLNTTLRRILCSDKSRNIWRHRKLENNQGFHSSLSSSSSACDNMWSTCQGKKFWSNFRLISYWDIDPLYGLTIAVRNDYTWLPYVHEYSLIYPAPSGCSTKERTSSGTATQLRNQLVSSQRGRDCYKTTHYPVPVHPTFSSSHILCQNSQPKGQCDGGHLSRRYGRGGALPANLASKF